MSDPKFQRGELVRHRASGEVAVVVARLFRCTKHKGEGEALTHHWNGFGQDCNLEFTGGYDLDLGFKEDVATVEEYLLERVTGVRGSRCPHCGEEGVEVTAPADLARGWHQFVCTNYQTCPSAAGSWTDNPAEAEEPTP